jgi:TRAP-type C4-dicarboxylate transport system substrate-binding protein
MLQTNSFTSVQHNFSNGIPLGADLIDEKTWNSLSSGAQQVILELSKTSVEYMSTAIDTAMS